MRGDGATVWDDDGNAYLDLVARHRGQRPRPRPPGGRRGGEPAGRDAGPHVATWSPTSPRVALAERLLALLGRDGRVFFANSGAEANEAAFKIARRTGRAALVVAAEGAFHGRTMGALALTGQPAKRAPFEPLPGGVPSSRTATPPRSRAAVDDTDGRGRPRADPGRGRRRRAAPAGYLAAAREVTRGHGALLVLDEVQTGIGRTGALVRPPGAGRRARRRHPGQGPRRRAADRRVHRASATRPRCSARASTARPSAATRCPARPRSRCSTRSRPTGLLERAERSGEALRAGIDRPGPPAGRDRPRRRPDARHRADRAGRGRGRDGGSRAGFLVNAVAPDVVRLAPPLVLTDAQADSFLSALPGGPRRRYGAAAARRRGRPWHWRRRPDTRRAGRALDAHGQPQRPRPPGTGGSSSCSRPGGCARRASSPALLGRRRAAASPRRRCPATSTSSARSGSATAAATWSTRCPAEGGDPRPRLAAVDGEAGAAGSPGWPPSCWCRRDASANLVVLRTPPGAAQFLASATRPRRRCPTSSAPSPATTPCCVDHPRPHRRRRARGPPARPRQHRSPA